MKLLKSSTKATLALPVPNSRVRPSQGTHTPTSSQHPRPSPPNPPPRSQKKPGPTVVLARRAFTSTTQCRAFETYGFCHYGSHCRFNHSGPPKPVSHPFRPPPLPKRNTKTTETPSTRPSSRRTITLTPRFERGRPGSVPQVAPPDRRTTRLPRPPPPLPSGSRRSASRRTPETPRHPSVHRPRHPATSVMVLIRVKNPESVHPASWKHSLKSQDFLAHSLVTWVERDIQDSRYLLVECASRDEACLINLLQKCKFITSKRPPQIETRKNREPRLPNQEDNVRSSHRRISRD